jgi:flagellar basal-body rod modification protein FlgD
MRRVIFSLRQGATSFEGDPIAIGFAPHSSTDSARLIVRNDASEIIYTEQINPESGSVDWHGSSFTSDIAPSGRYSFEIESYSGETLLQTGEGRVFDLVTEVRMDGATTFLVFRDGTDLALDKTTALRMPQL